MVDGLVNNQKKNQEKTSDASSNNQTSRNQQDGKSKKRRSVIKRLHQKQIAIARRSENRYPNTWIRKWKESGVEYAKVKV